MLRQMLRSGNESQRSVWGGWGAKSGFATDWLTDWPQILQNNGFMNTVCLDFPGRRLAEKPRMPKRLECLTENVMRQTARQECLETVRQGSIPDSSWQNLPHSFPHHNGQCMFEGVAIQWWEKWVSASIHPPGIKMTGRQAVQGEAPQLTYSPPSGETRASVLLKFKLWISASVTSVYVHHSVSNQSISVSVSVASGSDRRLVLWV